MFRPILSLMLMPLAAIGSVSPQIVLAAEPSSRALSAQDAAAVRCSAAFAIVAGQQARGAEEGYPPLSYRGREYMVQTGSSLIENGWSQGEVAAAMRDAAAALQGDAGDGALLAAVVPPCLALLDANVAPLMEPNLPQCTAIMGVLHEEALMAGGKSERARELQSAATALESLTRQEAAGQGRTETEIDAILALERQSVAEVAAMPGGIGRYDADVCYDLAKP